MFDAMYKEYALNPQITKIRMYYETLIDVLPGVKLYINTGSDASGTQMLLPLESLVDTASNNGGVN
jgi:membrane protease subunit HflK